MRIKVVFDDELLLFIVESHVAEGKLSTFDKRYENKPANVVDNRIFDFKISGYFHSQLHENLLAL
jgi:hypothetical protein